MSLIGIIDCGTTNSRCSIVDGDGSVRGRASEKIGVKDTATTGSNAALKAGLERLFRQAVETLGISPEEVSLVLSSGMITSEIGLVELPHLVAPVALKDLAAGLTRVEGTGRLDIGTELYLIRGVKNCADPAPGARIGAARALDFMRGEETQIMGYLARYGAGTTATIINLSSHTKYMNVSETGAIQGSVTTLSGQVYESIQKETFIGKSVAKNTDETAVIPAALLRETMDLAADLVDKSGLLRSLMLPRFMDTLMTTDWQVRRRFVESCLVADDLKALDLFPEYGFSLGANIVLIGLPERCAIFEYLLGRRLGSGKPKVVTISNPDEVGALAIHGALAIARNAGLLRP